MKNILLVEDEQFLANLLKIRLEKEGFIVHHAAEGQEALNFIKELKLDLILLDIILPKLSGFEILEAIRADSRLQDIPVMIISNLGQENDISRGQSLGAVEYIVKATVSIDELIGQIKKNLKITESSPL
ncbi:MAG: response regulator [Patescibacteria group bacterium]